MGGRKPGNRQTAGGAPTKKRAPTSTSWKPGQSGNPAGRPKLTENQREARAQAQAVVDAHSAEAAWKLAELLNDPEARVRLLAASSILDRAGVQGVKRIQLAGEGGGPVRVSAAREKLAEMLGRHLSRFSPEDDGEPNDTVDAESPGQRRSLPAGKRPLARSSSTGDTK